MLSNVFELFNCVNELFDCGHNVELVKDYKATEEFGEDVKMIIHKFKIFCFIGWCAKFKNITNGCELFFIFAVFVAEINIFGCVFGGHVVLF